MDVLRFIVCFFLKILGFIPNLLFLRPRYYYESRKTKNKPLKGKAILVTNHTNFIDYFALMFTFPFRRIRTLVSEAVYNFGLPGRFSRMMGDICVHRERSDMSWLEKGEKVLNKNGVVSIFPEGKFSTDGKIGEFKPSAIYLALRTGAPIIPIYIDAQYGKWHRTRVIIGNKIYLKDYCDEENPSIEKVQELCEMLRKKVLELKRLMGLYGKYKTDSFFLPKAWFLDMGRFLLWLPTKLFLWPRFHYVGKASYKDRWIKDRGILAAKHYSFMDGSIIDSIYISRRPRIIIGEEFMKTSPFLLTHLFCIMYRRKTDSFDPVCFMEVINLLKANGVVGIFPEGHLMGEEDGEIQEGAAYFSFVTNSPIYIFWPMQKFKFFHVNHIMIGETIYPDQIFTKEEMKDKANIARLNEILKERIKACNEAGKKYRKKPKNS